MKSINDVGQSEQARIEPVYHLRQAGTIQSESVAQAFLAKSQQPIQGCDTTVSPLQ